MVKNTHVVVLGGGYAGVMAANRLTQREDVTVTLVNARPAFVERIRLHQQLTGSYTAAVDYGKLLAPAVRLTVDTVTAIDAADRRLALASGGTVDYDYLVYAVGSRSAEAEVPGAAEFAHALASFEQMEHLQGVLDATPRAAAITVVGGGPTGIETAAELAEAGRLKVTLVCGGLLGPYLHPRARAAARRRLTRLGVRVVDGPGTKVTAVTRTAVHLANGSEVPSRVTIWTTGFSVPDLAQRSGLSTDGIGRLLTDETLTSVDDDRIVGAGDAVAPSGMPYRMSCQGACQLGPQAAETVLTRLAGKQPAHAQVGFVAQCISLGRHDGVYQSATRDDNAKSFYLAGSAGAAVKELICRSTVWQLKSEARNPGARAWWFKGSHREQLLQARRGPLPTTAERSA